MVGRGASITTHSPPAVEPTHPARLVDVSGAESDGKYSSEPACSAFQMRVSSKPATGTTKLIDTAANASSHSLVPASILQRGKAPPVDAFSGETTGISFDDCYPSLRRAADWNQWTD